MADVSRQIIIICYHHYHSFINLPNILHSIDKIVWLRHLNIFHYHWLFEISAFLWTVFIVNVIIDFLSFNWFQSRCWFYSPIVLHSVAITRDQLFYLLETFIGHGMLLDDCYWWSCYWRQAKIFQMETHLTGLNISLWDLLVKCRPSRGCHNLLWYFLQIGIRKINTTTKSLYWL